MMSPTRRGAQAFNGDMFGSIATQGPPDGSGGGHGGLYSAVPQAGLISEATGSFPSVSPGVSVVDVDGNTRTPESFSLQINSNYFKSVPGKLVPGCREDPKCEGWEQFVYQTGSDGSNLAVWLILINYAVNGKTCPDTHTEPNWDADDGSCYLRDDAKEVTPALTAASLHEAVLVASAGSKLDVATLTAGGNAYSSASEMAPAELELSKHWELAEFGVLGEGNSSMAEFSPTTTLTANTEIETTPASDVAPKCKKSQTTGESNNLTLEATPPLSAQARPTISSRETNESPEPEPPPQCAEWPPVPTVKLTTPSQGAVFGQNESVNADYTCEAAPEQTLISCDGNVASGEPLDTSTVGRHRFTVVATDADGQQSTPVTHVYTVTRHGSAPPPGVIELQKFHSARLNYRLGPGCDEMAFGYRLNHGPDQQLALKPAVREPCLSHLLESEALEGSSTINGSAENAQVEFYLEDKSCHPPLLFYSGVDNGTHFGDSGTAPEFIVKAGFGHPSCDYPKEDSPQQLEVAGYLEGIDLGVETLPVPEVKRSAGGDEAVLQGIMETVGEKPAVEELVECEFEYGLVGEGLTKRAQCNPPNAPPISCDCKGTVASATVAGLTPGAMYEYRISALGGETGELKTGNIETFPAQAAYVQLGGFVTYTRHSMTMDGHLVPRGEELDLCQFEYGRKGHGVESVIPCQPEEAGATSPPVRVVAKMEHLAANTAYEVRISAASTDSKEFLHSSWGGFTTNQRGAKIIGVGPSSIKQTEASVVATVLPEEEEITDCALEYGLVSESGYSAKAPCSPATFAPSDSEERVTATATNLKGGRQYKFRFVAKAEGEQIVSTSQCQESACFKTASPPPVVVTEAPTDVFQTSTVLNGSVNPEGEEVTGCEILLGLKSSSGYERHYSCSPAAGSGIGSGTEPVHVSAHASTLLAASEYKYVVVVERGSEKVEGTEQTFQTEELEPHWYAEGVRIHEGVQASVGAKGALTIVLSKPAKLACKVTATIMLENPLGEMESAGLGHVANVAFKGCKEAPKQSVCAKGQKPVVTAGGLPWKHELLGGQPIRDITKVVVDIACGSRTADVLEGSAKPEVGASTLGFGAGSGELSESTGGKASLTGSEALKGSKPFQKITAELP
jgi:hypothetical protein